MWTGNPSVDSHGDTAKPARPSGAVALEEGSEPARWTARTALKVCGTLRSFPKEINHPPALLGQGSTFVPMPHRRGRDNSVSPRRR